MVRRLIEKKEIRLAQKRLRETYSRPLPAREVMHILLEVLRREAQAKGDAADAALERIAAEPLERVDDAPVECELLLARCGGDLLFQCTLLLAEVDDVGKGTAKLLVERALAERRLLLDVANRRAIVKLHRSCVRFLFTQETAHQGRLARAVRADKTRAFAAAHLKGHIMKNLFHAKRFGKPDCLHLKLPFLTESLINSATHLCTSGRLHFISAS